MKMPVPKDARIIAESDSGIYYEAITPFQGRCLYYHRDGDELAFFWYPEKINIARMKGVPTILERIAKRLRKSLTKP